MTRRWALALATALLVAGGAAAGAVGWTSPAVSAAKLSTVGLDDAHLRLVGAWDRTGPGVARTVNAGSSLKLRTTGRRLVLRFDASSLPEPATVWVGSSRVEIRPGRPDGITKSLWRVYDVTDRVDVSSLLAEGGLHQVTMVVKELPRSVTLWGPGGSALALRGVEVGSTTDLQEPQPAGLRLTFLGDSITAGAGPLSGDGRLGFAYQTGAALYADTTVIGFLGQGVLQAGSAGVPPAPETLNAGVLAAADPDVVVVNYGTNDRSLDPGRVRVALTGYFGQIRALYPGAKLVVLRPFNGDQGDALAGAVDDRRKAGDSAIAYVDTAGWVPTTLTFDGIHPTQKGQTSAAVRLAKVIKSLLASG